MAAVLLTAFLGLLANQTPAPISAPTPDMRRAEQHDRRGWQSIDAQDFSTAAKEFGAALQINPAYADALHGLGKAFMGLQNYAQAVQVFERCRSAYAQAGTSDAEHRMLANRARQDRLRELRQRLAEIQNHSQPQATDSRMTVMLELRQQIRELEGERDPGELIAQRGTVPAFISLSLGSAYFRLGRLADAERAFRESIAVDPRFGEAHSNLALVCLLTARPDEAQQHVRLAEEARFKVNAELKRRIREALDARSK